MAKKTAPRGLRAVEAIRTGVKTGLQAVCKRLALADGHDYRTPTEKRANGLETFVQLHFQSDLASARFGDTIVFE